MSKQMTDSDIREVHRIVEAAIARHNRNATLISACLGITVLGFYSHGLMKVVEMMR